MEQIAGWTVSPAVIQAIRAKTGLAARPSQRAGRTSPSRIERFMQLPSLVDMDIVIFAFPIRLHRTARTVWMPAEPPQSLGQACREA